MREVSGQDLSIDMCQRLVGEFDADGTGTIDFREFQEICRRR